MNTTPETNDDRAFTVAELVEAAEEIPKTAALDAICLIMRNIEPRFDGTRWRDNLRGWIIVHALLDRILDRLDLTTETAIQLARGLLAHLAQFSRFVRRAFRCVLPVAPPAERDPLDKPAARR